jgi:hypothetical protein
MTDYIIKTKIKEKLCDVTFGWHRWSYIEIKYKKKNDLFFKRLPDITLYNSDLNHETSGGVFSKFSDYWFYKETIKKLNELNMEDELRRAIQDDIMLQRITKEFKRLNKSKTYHMGIW